MKEKIFTKYINKLIRKFQKTKIYIGYRIADNLIQVDEKLFNRYMKNKKYDMILTGFNRICIDINNNGKNIFVNNKIYIPNNVSRTKLPMIGNQIEINILYRWN